MSSRPLLAWLLCLPLALACGPYYNDAHRGIQDPLRQRFTVFYRSLFHADEAGWRARRRRYDRLRVDLAEAEDPARACAIRLKLVSAGLLKPGDVRRARDDADLLAAGWSDGDEGVIAYRRARDRAQLDRLFELLASDGDLRPFVVCTLADLVLRTGGGARRLVRQLGLDAPAGDVPWQLRLRAVDRLLVDLPAGHRKRDEAAYLGAFGRILRQLDRRFTSADELADCRERLAAYLEAWPAGSWRYDACGWQAHCIYRYPDLVSAVGPEGRPPLQTAIEIYQELLAEPAAGHLHAAAAESLYFCYRRLPAEAVPLDLFEDPRHALALLYFALHHPKRTREPFAQADLETLYGQAARGLQDLAGQGLDARTLGRFALGFHRLGRDRAALSCARQAFGIKVNHENRYLLGRMLVANGETEDLLVHLRVLCAAVDYDPRMVLDLGLRIGSAFEEQERWDEALTCYLAVDSTWDWHVLVDGQMPLDELQAFVRDHAEQPIPWREGADEPPVDLMPRVREALGVRLARLGRYREALPYLPPERAKPLRRLQVLRQDLDRAAPAERPARLYALGRHWYHHGKHLVFFSRAWHQWAWWWNGDLRPGLDRAVAERNVQAMTAELPALELFAEIYENHPDSPEAPKALYSCACCWYWLYQPGYFSHCGYWQHQARQGGFLAVGDALMRRLLRDYPDHELARGRWITERIREKDGVGR